MEEINGELLTLYVKLLGSHHEVHGFDVMVLEVGPKVSPTQPSILVTRFTREEIKAALLDIDNDKSPRPDGYTSYFFKKAWNLVGDEFCAAVSEFLESGQLLR